LAWVVPLGTTPTQVSQNPALKDIRLPNSDGFNLHATLLITKTLLIAGEGSAKLKLSARTTRRPEQCRRGPEGDRGYASIVQEEDLPNNQHRPEKRFPGDAL
jgi:hypothetical protein